MTKDLSRRQNGSDDAILYVVDSSTSKGADIGGRRRPQSVDSTLVGLIFSFAGALATLKPE